MYKVYTASFKHLMEDPRQILLDHPFKTSIRKVQPDVNS